MNEPVNLAAIVARKEQLSLIKRPALEEPKIIPPLGEAGGERRVDTFTIKERREESYAAFKAIARIKREKEIAKYAPRIVKVLMDPGAELNLIRAEILNADSCATRKLKIHAREKTNITLMNNGVEIGRVKEAVYLTFALDNADNTQQTHHEWMYVWEKMNEEMILGSAFCREQGLTCFHTRLAPWEEFLSHTAPQRPKRSREVDEVSREDVVPEDSKPARERDVLDHEHNPFQDLHERTRDRVITTPEKISEHAKKHAEQIIPPTPVVAGKRRAYKRGFAPEIIKKDFSNRVPVNYEKITHRSVMHILLNKTMQEQQGVLSKLKEITESKVTLTMDEAEILRDTARLCANEAEKVYSTNRHLLKASGAAAPTVTQTKQHRYFMEPFAEAEKVTQTEPTLRRFANGQCVTLQNLVTQVEMNNTPARIVAYDEDTHKYVISVSKPLGYWYATEDKLKSIDPLPTKDDYVACGIDQSTGQPTLDPLAKPVHRQYGNPYSAELTKKINELLLKYKVVFSKDITTPCKFKPMKIELIPGANLPRNPRCWKNSPAQREEVRKQLQGFLDEGIVRASSTAIVSNVLLVKRPGMPGKFRFTIDFRELNDATVAAPWQMPEVQSQLDRLAGNKIFGCLDLSSYYHQIVLDSGSRYLTGFITEDGVFEYIAYPWG